MAERDRPSRHGSLAGEALAALANQGYRDAPDLPERCATCAFRPGTMPNQMAGTTLAALNCVLGIDPDRFACHHGMEEGRPKKLCAGYIAALLAPYGFTKGVMSALAERLQGMEGPDELRAEFDRWIAEVDPDGAMDDYKRARRWACR